MHRSQLLIALSAYCVLVMPNFTAAECTALPTDNSLYTPVGCAFDDLLGNWSPTTGFISEWGDIAISQGEVMYPKDKYRIPITVLNKDHPIIIKKEGGYSRLEIMVSTFSSHTVLCFHDYNDLKDAQSKAGNVTTIYCYNR